MTLEILAHKKIRKSRFDKIANFDDNIENLHVILLVTKAIAKTEIPSLDGLKYNYEMTFL